MKILHNIGDLIGANEIVYLEEAGHYISPKGRKRRRVKVRCLCGIEFSCLLDNIRSGKQKSCGCGTNRKNRIKTKYKKGDSFPNGISFIEEVETTSRRRDALFRCLCDNTFISRISHVKSEHTISCGCRGPSKIPYKIGKPISENNLIYLGDVESKLTGRRGKFLCKCGEKFEAFISSVKVKRTTNCGCSSKSRGWSRSQYIKAANNYLKAIPKVYIIVCFAKEERFLKIGITYKSIKERFRYNFPYQYKIIAITKGTAEFVYDEEIRLKCLYRKFRYRPQNKFHGDSECFSMDILTQK